MASTTHRPGIISWAMGIRTTMVNDPGRQTLEDQIQCNGFLFLDDYLESILAGPQHDPIIELVKTPGRKKDAPKRTRAATAAAAKAKPLISFVLKDDGKENRSPNAIGRIKFAPVSKSNDSLQQYKDARHRLDDDLKFKEYETCPKPFDVVFENAKETIHGDVDEHGSIVMPNHSTKTSAHLAPTTVTEFRQMVASQHSQSAKDLSIIAEGDESAERPYMVIDERRAESVGSPKAQMPSKGQMAPIVDVDMEDITRSSNFTMSTSTSTRTFHSIPLESPPTASAATHPFPHTTLTDTPDYEGEALPLHAGTSGGSMENSPHKLMQKNSFLQFPTIGAPSPLHKSVRAPHDPSLATAPTSFPAVPSTTRSSWLVKAKEAKAIGESSKKVSIIGGGLTPGPKTGTKRKSAEVLPDTESESEAPQERVKKIGKLDEETPFHTPDDRKDPQSLSWQTSTDDMRFTQATTHEEPEGMMDRLKKTVQGYSSRAGKSMGKSLGGAAVAALAEAKAAAEAKVAERNGGRLPSAAPTPTDTAPVFAHPGQGLNPSVGALKESERRLSVSDLVTSFEAKRNSKEPERVFQPPPLVRAQVTQEHAGDNSTTTTPPNSPPPARTAIFTAPPGPIEKPKSTVSVFGVPTQPSVEFLFPASTLSRPSLLSAQSTQSSQFSDAIFDHDAPAWLPSTQETDYDNGIDPQLSLQKLLRRDDEPDGDESWHLDDKFAAREQLWSPVVGTSGSDDSMTWSTIRTQSRTQPLSQPESDQLSVGKKESHKPRGTTVDTGLEDAEVDAVAEDGLPAASLAEDRGTHTRSNSQTSVTTSQMGLLSAATKFVSSVLGGSKKGKEPVKSLQLAAVAAKKQQEEADKKAARLKEMEARRHMVMQKKAEEEKAREQRRIKEENERRKRERDDNTEKRALRQPVKKNVQSDDETNKKRKAGGADEKKDAKKPPSKDSTKDKKDLGTSRIGKPAVNNAHANADASTFGKSTKQSASTVQVATSVSIEDKKATVPNGSSAATSAKAKAKENGLSGIPPSQLLNAQMQARVDAQLQEARKAEQAAVPSESIELPEINSEYSDSEDEDRVRTFDPPDWAQSPELREALQSQSTWNPDSIFGPIKPLRMDELFKARASKFRARTSSANWAGTDRLTIEEERDYAIRMGYTS